MEPPFQLKSWHLPNYAAPYLR